MLNNTLSTNEIKNSVGTGISFSRISTGDRKTVFAQVGESPSLPHRLSIQHAETGSGLKARRRSVVRFDKTVISPVDDVTPVTVSAYIVADIPTGALETLAEPTNVIAELQSFVASLGANSTILHDGTGNGATAVLQGGL